MATISTRDISVLLVTGVAAVPGYAAPPRLSYHAPTAADIVVTAPSGTERVDMLSGVSILQGAKLTEQLRPTIGEMLDRQPGVSATSFGPNASRPVLRGLQGERVRVLTDGIGSIDVSNTSVDHAVVIDPLLADRVEVLRGPAALLYGSGAIGGVVNVIDKRIPRRIPDEPIHVDALATYASAAKERSLTTAVDVPIGDKLVVHADGSYLKTDDLDIGGHVLSRDLRRQAGASGDPGIAALADPKGRLPNTASRTWQAGLGAAIITSGGSLGLSYNHYDSLYGVPIRYGLAPGVEAEAPRIDLLQNRIDFRGEIDAGGGLLQTIRTRFAYAQYRHFELARDGSVDTAFYNHGAEGRIDLVQAKHGSWSGTTGVQGVIRDFDVIGDEAFLPRNTTQQLGLFTLQTLDWGRLRAEAGARYEVTRLGADPRDGQAQFFAGGRRFATVSASAGASYALVDDWRFGLNLSRTVRAPSAEELFANGPHAGTEAFEIGDPALRTEKSWGLEAVLRGKAPGFTVEASLYHDWFHDFIYDIRTGAVEDDLPVYATAQASARYYGAEVQATAVLGRAGTVTFVADGLADYVHANIKRAGPAPRIPPLRLLGGIEAQSPRLDGRLEIERSWAQRRTAPLETATPGFALVNASATLRPWGREGRLSFVLSAENLLDVTARRHASFLKDYAPLAGRDLRITARAAF